MAETSVKFDLMGVESVKAMLSVLADMLGDEKVPVVYKDRIAKILKPTPCKEVKTVKFMGEKIKQIEI